MLTLNSVIVLALQDLTVTMTCLWSMPFKKEAKRQNKKKNKKKKKENKNTELFIVFVFFGRLGP